MTEFYLIEKEMERFCRVFEIANTNMMLRVYENNSYDDIYINVFTYHEYEDELLMKSESVRMFILKLTGIDVNDLRSRK